jgi:hypothetical protein
MRHQCSGKPAEDYVALLVAILADGINLSLPRMAEPSRDMTVRRLSCIHDWHVREDCYVAALGRLIGAHRALPLPSMWGDGTTSSLDGQFFHTGGHGEAIGDVNAGHGNEQPAGLAKFEADHCLPAKRVARLPTLCRSSIQRQCSKRRGQTTPETTATRLNSGRLQIVPDFWGDLTAARMTGRKAVLRTIPSAKQRSYQTRSPLEQDKSRNCARLANVRHRTPKRILRRPL